MSYTVRRPHSVAGSDTASSLLVNEGRTALPLENASSKFLSYLIYVKGRVISPTPACPD